MIAAAGPLMEQLTSPIKVFEAHSGSFVQELLAHTRPVTRVCLNLLELFFNY